MLLFFSLLAAPNFKAFGENNTDGGSNNKQDTATAKAPTNSKEVQNQDDTEKKSSPKIIVRGKTASANINGLRRNISTLIGPARTAKSVPEILDKETGTTVNRLGAHGTYSTLSFRGLDANQSSVYIDGIPLNDPMGGPVNLENLPTGVFREMEVYKSFTPLHLSGSLGGGAINLLPDWPNPGSDYYVVDGYAHSLPGGGLGGGLARPWTMQYVSGEGSLNEYEYLDRNGTVFHNTADDRTRTRRNEDFTRFGYSGLYKFHTGQHSFRILTDAMRKERGIGGQSNLPLRKVRYAEERYLAGLSYQTLLTDSLIVKTTGAGRYFSGQVTDPAQELSFGLEEQRRVGRAAQGSIQPLYYPWGRHLEISSSHSIIYTQVDLDKKRLADRREIENGAGLRLQADQIGRFIAQGKILAIKDDPGPGLQSIFLTEQNTDPIYHNPYTWTIHAGLFIDRWFDHSQRQATPPSSASPKQQPSNLEEGLEVYAALSEGQRVPSVTESYGDGKFVLANPELKPEKNFTARTGVQAARGKEHAFKFDSAVFQIQASNLIAFVQNSERTIRAVNIGQATIKGAEVEASYAYRTYFEILARHTLLDTTDESNFPFYRGNRLPFRPLHSTLLYLEGGLTEVRLFSEIRSDGSLYRDRYNSRRLFIDRRTFVDVGIILRKADWQYSRLVFTIKNILDTKQNDVFNYPLPGRYYQLLFTARL